jgi:hypothetical protein
MTSASLTSSRRGDQALDRVLGPIHARWLEDVRRFLEPALHVDANHWDRWSAVRYLADDCRQQLLWEGGLVQELRHFIEPDRGARLTREGETVGRLRLELDRIGRRRGTAAEFAAGAQAFLEQLGCWCAEIEKAARGLTRATLPPEGGMFLAHLEAMCEVRR